MGWELGGWDGGAESKDIEEGSKHLSKGTDICSIVWKVQSQTTLKNKGVVKDKLID